MSNPRIVRDSIASGAVACRSSVIAGGRYACVEGTPVTMIALADVAAVEVRRKSTGRTVGAIVLGIVVVGGVLFAIYVSERCYSPFGC